MMYNFSIAARDSWARERVRGGVSGGVADGFKGSFLVLVLFLLKSYLVKRFLQ